MPELKCPIADCGWKSQNLEKEFADALSAALIAHLSSVHPAPSLAAKAEKLDHPTISKGCTSEDWGYFLSLWSSYKNATKLDGSDVNIQLLACCDADLRRDLYRTGLSLESKPEKDVLLAMKQLSVKQENVMVSRLALHNMTQDRGEGVRNYEARLRGQANVCQFLIKCVCNSDVNYTDQVIKDVLVRGLYDHEIQTDILGHENQDMSLASIVGLIEAKEAGRRSQASITTDTAHAVSTYRKLDKSKDDVERKYKCEKCQRPGIRPLGRNGKVRQFKLCKTCFGATKATKRENTSSGITNEEEKYTDVTGGVDDADLMRVAEIVCKPIKI